MLQVISITIYKKNFSLDFKKPLNNLKRMINNKEKL